nr:MULTISPECIES: hypothetical protein [unclassified Streptomyces]
MTDTVLAPTAAGRLFSRPAAVASCVGFVLIGTLQALYGPAVPGPRAAGDGGTDPGDREGRPVRRLFT